MSRQSESTPNGRRVVEDTVEEHREAMHVVGELESCLERKPDREGVWLADVSRILPRMRSTMVAHFRSEESGALFDRLPQSHPHLADRLDTLRAEHDKLGRMMDELIERAQASVGAETYDLRELSARAQLLVATLRRHEAAENELVVEALWNETGAVD